MDNIMICKTSCAVFVAFLVGTILMNIMTHRLPIVDNLMTTLDSDLQAKYKSIAKMRATISLQGYGLGLLLSVAVLGYNYTRPKSQRYTTNTMVCVAGAVTFLTQYFYYILTPKTDWMLHHLKTPEQNRAWLAVYRTMSWNYHASLLVGVLSALMLGRVFKCEC